MIEFANLAYDAYAKELGYVEHGVAMPLWISLPLIKQNAWRSAVDAIDV